MTRSLVLLCLTRHDGGRSNTSAGNLHGFGTASAFPKTELRLDQYRRKARRYLIRTRQMLNPVNRVTMMDMAVIWMRMAEWAKSENPVI